MFVDFLVPLVAIVVVQLQLHDLTRWNQTMWFHIFSYPLWQQVRISWLKHFLFYLIFLRKKTPTRERAKTKTAMPYSFIVGIISLDGGVGVGLHS